MSTLPERVLDWTETYCESLTENYKQHSVRMYESSTSDYSKQCLENVKNGTANLTNFVIKNGRKYYKIMQREFDTFKIVMNGEKDVFMLSLIRIQVKFTNLLLIIHQQSTLDMI